LNELIRLKDITAQLRSENGCNWDKKQTHQSLVPFLIEETYEVVDAVEKQDFQHLKEELGDLLFNVYFQAQIAAEAQRFTIEDVAKEVSEKLIRRHPHVFEMQSGLDADEVLKNWNLIKEEEKKAKGKTPDHVLDIVSNALPALIKAEKLQTEAARYGFDWSSTEGVLAKIKEEISELEHELTELKNGSGDANKIQEELGDVLFSVINLSRFCKVSSELALNLAGAKFRKRFNFIEDAAKESGKSLRDITPDEMEEQWNKAKALLR
jgi:MazG family protein